LNFFSQPSDLFRAQTLVRRNQQVVIVGYRRRSPACRPRPIHRRPVNNKIIYAQFQVQTWRSSQ